MDTLLILISHVKKLYSKRLNNSMKLTEHWWNWFQKQSDGRAHNFNYNSFFFSRKRKCIFVSLPARVLPSGCTMLP
jgi:hypothetical protein